MHILKRRTRFEIWAPAKLNLFLEVQRRRADGYHEIETLMVPVGIYDTLDVSAARNNRLTVICKWAPGYGTKGHSRFGGLPSDEDNLVTRAMQLVRQRCAVSSGATVRIIKRIPCSAGLGGGSSDAAAALVAANLLWKLELPTSTLLSWAAELGSDVPFFLFGRAAMCRGRGEQIEPAVFPYARHFVIVRPPVGLSTASVYGATVLDATPQQWNPPFGARGSRFPLFNRLQPAAERLSPWIGKLRDRFDQLDVLGHQMSGSGSCYFGVCRSRLHARRIGCRLRSEQLGHVFTTHSCRTHRGSCHARQH